MSFVRSFDELPCERKKMFGGSGEAIMYKLLNGAEEMYGKGRVFNYIRLEKDCEVAWHIHNGDGETYFILKGEGEYSDNGKIVTLKAGDVTICPAGTGHGIANNSNEDVEICAVIVYA